MPFLLLLLLLMPLAASQAPPAHPALSDPAFRQAYEDFSSDASLRHASWGLYVSDATTGQVLMAHDPFRALTPASVQKLVTTLSALRMLGPDHTFHTALQHDGQVSPEGRLQGNLFIRGSGDPSLGAWRMDDSLSLDRVFGHFLQLLQDRGIRSIHGDIVGDEGAFDREAVPRKWLWEDMGNYFGTVSSALSANENEYTVYFRAGSRVGEPATVLGHEPHIPGLSFLNEVRTGPRGSGDQVYIFGAPGIPERRLTGTVPLGATRFPVRGSMPDPAGFLAGAFRQYLQEQGIVIVGQARSTGPGTEAQDTPPARRTTLGSWESPPLFEIVHRTNLASVNLYAENLLRVLGGGASGEGSLQAGLEAVRRYWTARGIDLSGMVLHDGSGLSPSNRLTAGQLGRLLEAAAGDRLFPALYNSLPLAGFSGSLAGFFHGTSSEGILRAKSGFLGNVRAYAGYTTLQDGSLAAFVLIVNDYEGSPAAMRQRMFRLMDAVTGLKKP